MNRWISITKYLRYQYDVLSKPRVNVHLHNSNDSDKIMYQQWTIHWQSKCQISNKSVKSNNNYSSFCEITLKQQVFNVWRYPQRPGIEVLWGHLTKPL